MKKQISNISVYQSSKVLSILPTVIIAIFAFPLGIILITVQMFVEGMSLFIFPFIWLLFFFITHAIVFALYNLIAKKTGGIEVTFKDVE